MMKRWKKRKEKIVSNEDKEITNKNKKQQKWTNHSPHFKKNRQPKKKFRNQSKKKKAKSLIPTKNERKDQDQE
jgi:hypothetical protein